MSEPKADSTTSIEKELKTLASALHGASDLARTGAKASEELLDEAGVAIVGAILKFPQLDLIDLRLLAPEFQFDRLPLSTAQRGNLYESLCGPFCETRLEALSAQLCMLPVQKVKQASGEEPIPAKRMVTTRAWRILAMRHDDKLPPALAYTVSVGQWMSVGEEFLGRWQWSWLDFLKAAWVCECLAKRIQVLEGERDASAWLRLCDAAKRIGRPAGTLKKACDRGEIRHNDGKGHARRLDPTSVANYGKRLDAVDSLRALEAEAEQQNQGERNGWTCSDCQRHHPPGKKPKTCRDCLKSVRFTPAVPKL